MTDRNVKETSPAWGKARETLAYAVLILLLLTALAVLAAFFVQPLLWRKEAKEKGYAVPATDTMHHPEFVITDSGELRIVPSRCSFKKTVAIPDTVNGIRVSRLVSPYYYMPDSVETLVLPTTLNKLKRECGLEEFDGVKRLYVQNGTQILDAHSITGMNSLETLYLPASVERVEAYWLSDCPCLSVIYFGGTEENWHLMVGNSVPETVRVVCEADTFYRR
ncbi:MAG: hypothetical protein MJ078_00550 [Clostridia bacterium]|nr:hypothetical protein [Clostridia bacterium]